MQRVYELLCGDTHPPTMSNVEDVALFTSLGFTPQRYTSKTSKIFFKRINTFIFLFTPFRHHNIIFTHSISFTPLGLVRSHFSFHPSFLILESFYPLVRKSPPCPKNCPHGGQAHTIKIFTRFSSHTRFYSSHPQHITKHPFTPSFL